MRFAVVMEIDRRNIFFVPINFIRYWSDTFYPTKLNLLRWQINSINYNATLFLEEPIRYIYLTRRTHRCDPRKLAFLSETTRRLIVIPSPRALRGTVSPMGLTATGKRSPNDLSVRRA